MAIVRYTHAAAKDLKAISEAMTIDDGSEAERFLSSLRLHCRQLARVPGMGRARPEFGSDVRCFLINPVVVYYRRGDDGAVVLRVLRPTRDEA